MKGLLVESVETIGASAIRITWKNGKTNDIDLSDLIRDNPNFKPLKVHKAFAAVALEEWGHGIEWACGVDIGSETLWRMAQEQAGNAWKLEEFIAWRERNSLSYAQVAAILHITRRSVIYYHMGHKPIPLVLRLACLGWEALLREEKRDKKRAA